MNILSLPLEVLRPIAFYIESAGLPSLHAFSLATRACHDAALLVTFKQISITVNDREELRRDVDALTEALTRTNSFRYVQHITIKGALQLRFEPIDIFDPYELWPLADALSEILGADRAPNTRVSSMDDESVIMRGSEEDLAWAPLVNLLQARIPLKNLVYDCRSQFPPSLLDILHEQHPRCRLHHLTLKFRTLFWSVPHPYEMELATSPLLYRAMITPSYRDIDGDDDFNLEAMMELATGLAPNLQEIIVQTVLQVYSRRSVRPRSSWQGLPGFTRGRLGSLKSLSLRGMSKLYNPTILQEWGKHINFSCLQRLDLGGGIDATTFGLSGATMEWVAQSQLFTQVRTLRVYLNRDDIRVDRPHYIEQTISFFRTFESLEELSIDGPIDSKVFDTVLSQHGQTLRKLALNPYEEPISIILYPDIFERPFVLTKDLLLQIEAQCPLLEDLAIPVRRNESSASEVEIYRCFSKMKKLRCLFIMLDCSNRWLTRDRMHGGCSDSEDGKCLECIEWLSVRRNDFKETFINCAIDETLACSIWKIVSEHKASKRLERLKLWPTGLRRSGEVDTLPDSLQAMAQHMARSWLIERIPRDDREDFTIRELWQEGREAHNVKAMDFLSRHGDPEMLEIFRSV